MGNLETIPPYTLDGKEYPAGRIIQGTQGLSRPYMLEFLQAQEVQDPILLETDWLFVGHVDEIVQFLPAKNSRDWVMLVADPHSGLEILKQAQASGHGCTRVFSRQDDPEGNPPDIFHVPGGLHGVPDYSIDDLLAQDDFILANDNFSARMKANIDILRTMMQTYTPSRISLRAAAALYPAVINGVVLSDTQYLAPNPWGPIVDGRDIMADVVKEVYKKAGFDLIFIDDWNSHHTWGGDVHCGTNMIRDGSRPWW
ncbi:hypothetical protein AJ80_03434 [Polytolypa hystricis UAMH7299]|uniref:Protein-arginine deiminase C-terminal domain-containing protein n=1 Tax=Polytolypa hystricis (strain UAMH7299) TaxID=1447883 RepID=A0A2B7YJK1_POLH7|nr:hypothetical protein AJ80_03434 [Polytolypa hystricis UAMH7299]